MASFLKSKIFLSVLFLGLTAFIVGGITMAWFTSDAELEAAEFKAGTVEIIASEENEDGDSYPIIKMPEMNLNSVNPGDCATVIWEFVNEGTKDVQLKVKLTEEWSKSKLKVKHVYLCPIDPVDGKGWVMGEGHEDDNEGEIWLYYVDWSSDELGSVPGTISAEHPEDRTVQLKVVVVFDKEEIDNDYQGETYTLGGDGSAVYAIQASNQAPDTQWGEWTTVSQKGYEPDSGVAGKNYEYFHNPCKRGSDTECWLRANGEEPQDPNKCKVTILYKDNKGNNVRNQEKEYFYPGDWATITAPEITGYKFKEWSVPGWLDEEFTNGGKTIGFEMPNRNDLVITAKYEKEVNIKSFEIDDVKAEGRRDPNRTIVTGEIENLKDTNNHKVNGPQPVRIVASVNPDGRNNTVTQTFDLILDFDDGEADFTVEVLGVRDGTDEHTSVTITIGGVTRSAQGDD